MGEASRLEYRGFLPMPCRREPTRDHRELETAGFSEFGDALDRFECLFESLKQRPFDPVLGLVDSYLHGCVRIHVHTRIVGNDAEVCTVLVSGLQARREREGTHSGGQVDCGVGALRNHVSVLVDVPELVEAPKRMGAVSRPKVVGLRHIDNCLSIRGDAAHDAWLDLLPLIVGRWFRQKGEACLSGRFSSGTQYQLLREMIQRRPRVVHELADESVEPGLDGGLSISRPSMVPRGLSAFGSYLPVTEHLSRS